MTKKRKKLFIIGIVLILVIVGTLLGTLIPACKKKAEREELQRLFQEHYNARITAFANENATLENVDVAFIGDSLTEGYDLAHFYPQYKTVNRGIGGDTTFGVEQRLQVSLYDIQPKVVVMLIGANNFSTMMDNYESILQQLQTNLPNSKIVLLSLTAMSQKWGRNNDKAILNNQRIKSLSVKYGFTFIDLFTPLCNPDTNELYPSYTTDGGHLTLEGYTVLTQTITPVLQTLLP